MQRSFFMRYLVLALLLAAPVHAADPASELNVVFATPDHIELRLDYFRPAGDGPFPLVVCIHGGGWQAGSRATYQDTQNWFAKKGFASAAIQYRFAPRHRFPSQLEDVSAALRFLVKEHKRFRIDPDRIGMLGASAGAHLALLTGFSELKDCKIKAVVNMAGPTDLRTFAAAHTGDAALKTGLKRDSAELLADLLGTKDRKAEVYKTASPVAHIRKDGPAVLTLHGEDDDIVPIAQAESLHEALKKAGATERLIKIKGVGHVFTQWPEKERTAVTLATIDFLEEHLSKPAGGAADPEKR